MTEVTEKMVEAGLTEWMSQIQTTNSLKFMMRAAIEAALSVRKLAGERLHSERWYEDAATTIEVQSAEISEKDAEIANLKTEVLAWRECSKYDPMMSGETIFKGWDRSALDRCRRKFIESDRKNLK